MTSAPARFLRPLLTLTLTVATAALCGCGLGTLTPTGPQSLGSVGGRAMGGEQPITGATVTLMETQSNGYGGNGNQLGNATVTDSNGFFNLSDTNGGSAPVLSCDTGQEVYIVIAGGSPDGGAHTNDSILQAATLGPCGSTLSFTVVNEITTVATAYALDNFATITGTGSSALIQISAPANNNSVAATNNVASGTTFTASGLLHAFQNAANIVDMSNGVAYTVPASGAGAVPQAFIHTVANILQSCVNSDGSTSAGTNCASLYAATPDRGGTLPTNPFQAAMNMAKNPYVSSSNVTAVFGLIPGTPAFTPSLTAAPQDWTLAVSYPVPAPVVFSTGVVSASGQPFMPALDADDNVYMATTPGDVNGTTQTSGCLAAYNSAGALLLGGVFGCNQSGTSTTPTTAYSWAVPDAIGDLQVINYTSATSPSNAAGIFTFKTSTGALLGTEHLSVTSTRDAAIAVNKLNEFYVSTDNNNPAGPTFLYYQYSTTSGGTWTRKNFSTNPHTTTAGHDMVFDANQNVWIAEFGASTAASGGAVGYLYYSVTGFPLNPVLSDTAVAGGTATANANNSLPIGIAIDRNGDAWVTNDGVGTSTSQIGITKLTHSGGAPAPSVDATITNSAFNKPQYPEADGAGVLWIPDTAGIHAYDTVGGTFISQTANVTTTKPSGGFEPCYLTSVGTATSCSQSWSDVNRQVAIDSTGSVWYLYPTLDSTGRLFQIIGTAAPTWPLLAQCQPGVEPQ